MFLSRTHPTLLFSTTCLLLILSQIPSSHQQLTQAKDGFDAFIDCTWCKVGTVLGIGFILVFSCLGCLCSFVFCKTFLDARSMKKKQVKMQEKEVKKNRIRAKDEATLARLRAENAKRQREKEAKRLEKLMSPASSGKGSPGAHSSQGSPQPMPPPQQGYMPQPMPPQGYPMGQMPPPQQGYMPPPGQMPPPGPMPGYSPSPIPNPMDFVHSQPQKMNPEKKQRKSSKSNGKKKNKKGKKGGKRKKR